MIEGIYLLLEVLAIIVCLFWLYGEKIRLDIYNVILVICHIGLMMYVSHNGLGYIYTIIIYGFIALYCVLEFGKPIRKAVINTCIMLVMVGTVQLFVSLIMNAFYKYFTNQKLYFVATNLLVLVIVFFLYYKFQIDSVIKYLKTENVVVRFLEATLFFAIIIFLLRSKYVQEFEGINYAIFFLLSIVAVLLLGLWEKSRAKAREKELEIHAYGVYAEAYNELLDMIRMRQHEFDNHLQTIISLQHSYTSYEALVEAQQNYIGDVQASNKYNRLCRKGNPIFIGFLYGKLCYFEKKEVLIQCRLDFKNLDMDIPMYKFIEIVSNLLNNAYEALNLPTDVPEPICLEVLETEENIRVEVLNRCEPINLDYLCSCFKKGKSNKGEGRGLGLYNVKLTCEEYHARISLENKMLEEKNWI